MSVELEEVAGFLGQHEPFSHLPEEVLAGLPAQMTVTYVRRGETIVAPGQARLSMRSAGARASSWAATSS